MAARSIISLFALWTREILVDVLDEPTAYLDPSHEAEAVAEILEQLKDKTVFHGLLRTESNLPPDGSGHRHGQKS